MVLDQPFAVIGSDLQLLRKCPSVQLRPLFRFVVIVGNLERIPPPNLSCAHESGRPGPCGPSLVGPFHDALPPTG